MEIAIAQGSSGAPPGDAWLRSVREHYASVGHPFPLQLAAWADARPTRVYLGHEFCEHLLPRPAELREALSRAERAGLEVTLATPVASDACIARLKRLLPLLPDGGEVVCSDWGVASLLAREHPRLRAIAGRQLCRVIKDPRLPSAQWTKLHPHGLGSPAFALLLERCNLLGMELDLPPFVEPSFFDGLPRPAAVHAPFGYAAKGRVCRIGSAAQRTPRRFSAGHACRRECLDYRVRVARAPGAADLSTAQMGNTLLYGHSESMGAVLAGAMARGRVARLVLQDF